MNAEQFDQWKKDATLVLTASKYTKEQADIITGWFSRIKGEDERELVGSDFVNTFADNYPAKHFSVYDSMMARLFVYAPYILEQPEG